MKSEGTFRFGDFHIDASARTLRREEEIVTLNRRAFDVLLYLVQNPGKVLTRDQLLKNVWPDTVVDENSLAQSISALRRALEEKPGDNSFIVTLPGRGYQFVAPVKVAAQENSAIVPIAAPGTSYSSGALLFQQQTIRTSVITEEKASYGAGSLTEARATQAPRPWRMAVPVLLVTSVMVVGLYYRSRQTSRLTQKDSVVIADFSNTTGDTVFDDTLKTALNISLRQSPFLNVLSDSEVTKTLQQMTRPANTKLSPEVTRELCLRAGKKAYIEGSISSLGSEYVVGLKASNCQNGDTLAEEQAIATSREKVLDVLGKEASKLRKELGESLATVQKFDVPLAQATTSSLEALKEYSLGQKATRDRDPAAALPFDQHAIQVDPNFAMGYVAVGVDYFSLNQPGRAAEYYAKAFQLREHVSERERLAISAWYYLNVTGQLDKAAHTFQDEIESYPLKSGEYVTLGVVLSEQGQYQEAAEAARQAVRLAPAWVGGYENLANDALGLQRYDEARQAIRDAQARKIDGYLLHVHLCALAFLEADPAAMVDQQKWLAGKQEYEHFGLAFASDTEAYEGHVSKARELTKRAVESAIRADNKENGALWQANAALQQAAYGNLSQAQRSAAEAIRIAPASQGVEVEAALALAIAGDAVRAESLAQDLGKRFPLDTQMQSLWLPAIQAQLALDKKQPGPALNALRAASSIELGNIPFGNNLSCLYHVYLRGQAYLAAGQGYAAAAEFHKVLDHGGIVWNCWTGALAHLGAARADALQSKTFRAQGQGADADAARARAIASYKDFLTLWKDADPDIPILKEAEAEYLKLQ
jgi:DNA-binding winged helix-turn-helix (wHTH) protein/Tfp pilus assembly protein PilF